jgi:hypothetical protein
MPSKWHCQPLTLSMAEIALTIRGAKVHDAARAAGVRDLGDTGDTGEAYFEVRPCSRPSSPINIGLTLVARDGSGRLCSSMTRPACVIE